MASSKPILIAYDGSEGSKAATTAAGEVFAGRRALVISVWHSAVAAAPASLLALPAAVATRAYEGLDRESEQQAAALAAEGSAEANAVGLDATGEARRCADRVWATIVVAAEELGAAAIVIGSRERPAIASAILGSVANGVVHHSSVPVLVAPVARGGS